MLKTSEYRDNNNFVKLNLVSTVDSRYNPFEEPHEDEFVDLTVGPIWVGNSRQKLRNITFDGFNYE